MNVFVMYIYAFRNHNKMSAKWLKEIVTYMSVTSTNKLDWCLWQTVKCTERRDTSWHFNFDVS